MKKFIILSFCFISLLNGMEQQPKREAREWNAQDYANGNSFQEKMALEFLEQSNIDLFDKDVVDAGCGTGNISEIMAQKAKRVHGFDASLNMINYAREKYDNIPNLTFEHCFAEDFNSSIKHDLVTAFFCLHWFEDREAAFQRFYENLKPGGELLGTIHTTSNKKPIALDVFDDMFPNLKSIVTWLKSINVIQATGSSYPTDEELTTMLKEAGFKEISIEKKPLNLVFKNRDELITVERPIIMSRPLTQHIPEILLDYLFNSFIDKYIEKLEKLMKDTSNAEKQP